MAKHNQNQVTRRPYINTNHEKLYFNTHRPQLPIYIVVHVLYFIKERCIDMPNYFTGLTAFLFLYYWSFAIFVLIVFLAHLPPIFLMLQIQSFRLMSVNVVQ